MTIIVGECCGRVKLRTDLENNAFNSENTEYYFQTSFSLTDEVIHGFPVYASNTDNRYVKHCDLDAWMFSEVDDYDVSSDCSGEIHIESEAQCLEDVSSEDWKFINESGLSARWTDSSSPIWVECVNEGVR